MVAVPRPWPKAATAELMARAVIASAAVYGDDPRLALSRELRGVTRRCVAPALRAIATATGAPKSRTALALGLTANKNSSFGSSVGVARTAEAAALQAIRTYMASRPTAPPSPARIRAVVPAFASHSRGRSGFGQLDRLQASSAPHPTRAQVADSDRALIEAALAAGKVTRIPDGHAAGLSTLEMHLFAAPPPRPEGGWRGSTRNQPARKTGTPA